MKKIFTILATVAVLFSYGQTGKTALDLPDLQSLIIAENNFARLSKEKNTKEAYKTEPHKIDCYQFCNSRNGINEYYPQWYCER